MPHDLSGRVLTASAAPAPVRLDRKLRGAEPFVIGKVIGDSKLYGWNRNWRKVIGDSPAVREGGIEA